MTHFAATDRNTSGRRKSTLFCWGCDHENPLDGDWDRRPIDRHVEYVCPVCETTIAKRPLPNSPPTERATPTPSVMWQRTLHTTIGVWRASIDVGLSTLAVATAVQASSGHR